MTTRTLKNPERIETPWGRFPQPDQGKCPHCGSLVRGTRMADGKSTSILRMSATHEGHFIERRECRMCGGEYVTGRPEKIAAYMRQQAETKKRDEARRKAEAEGAKPKFSDRLAKILPGYTDKARIDDQFACDRRHEPLGRICDRLDRTDGILTRGELLGANIDIALAVRWRHIKPLTPSAPEREPMTISEWTKCVFADCGKDQLARVRLAIRLGENPQSHPRWSECELEMGLGPHRFADATRHIDVQGVPVLKEILPRVASGGAVPRKILDQWIDRHAGDRIELDPGTFAEVLKLRDNMGARESYIRLLSITAPATRETFLLLRGLGQSATQPETREAVWRAEYQIFHAKKAAG